ncbi:MAG: nucleotidyltransferase family protein [Verrucomicrobiia bacterium]
MKHHNSNKNIGCLILAAGLSTRMGENKLLLKWAGSTIIGHIVNQWRLLGVGQIAIVINDKTDSIIEELKRMNFDFSNIIVNPTPENGMFSSIKRAALWNGWKNNINKIVIVLGDQPHIKTDILTTLLKFSEANEGCICQPSIGEKRAHPIVIPTNLFRTINDFSGETLKEFIHKTDAPVRLFQTNETNLLLDIDTPEDYQKIISEFDKT